MMLVKCAACSFLCISVVKVVLLLLILLGVVSEVKFDLDGIYVLLVFLNGGVG